MSLAISASNRCLFRDEDGIEQADSWTTDGHKWLNTPYDCAMVICSHPLAHIASMNSDAVYMDSNNNNLDAQKNLVSTTGLA